jgi:hypothetical protein
MEKFEGTAPSGCGFWRLAAAGKSFHTVAENHFNCAVGAYTHNIPRSPAREKGTEQTFFANAEVEYVHVRSTTAGCYLFRVERAEQP